MRVALVGAELEENLALRSIDAAVRAAGHLPRIFDFHAPGQLKSLVDELMRFRPDAVGLSMVFTIRAREFLALAAALREAGYPGHITAGGFFASLHAELLLRDEPALDSVLHGEGEEGLVELLAGLDAPGQVRGLTRRLDDGHLATSPARPLPGDLDGRPWPTRPERFHAYQGLPIANLLSGRGCYAHCNFCSIDAWTRFSGGPRFRQRAVEPLADEMAWLYHARGARLFNFHDDNFFLPKASANLRRFGQLRAELEHRGVGRVGLQVKARPDSITPQVVKALVGLGVFRVFLGVESNSVNGLKALGRGITREQNHVALNLLKGAGLHVTCNLLMFEPACTLDDLRENVAFMRAHDDVPLNFCRTEVYGGTPLERDLAAKGRLMGDYLGFEYRIADERAQCAWEISEAVFTPRNFTLEGANHRAMAVEYEWKILQHFRPRHAGARLTRRVNDFVRAVNASNAELLDQVIALAADPGAAAGVAEGTQALARELLRAEELLGARASALLTEIHQAAQRTPLARRVAKAAAGAAAAATLLMAPACDEFPTHMSEMAPAPPAHPRTCTQPEQAAVETAVNRALGAGLANLLAKHETSNLTRIDVRVRTDRRGTIFQATGLLGPGHGTLQSELETKLRGMSTTVFDVECVVALYAPPDATPAADAGAPVVAPPETHFSEMAAPPTHMAEMAPRPPTHPKKKPSGNANER